MKTSQEHLLDSIRPLASILKAIRIVFTSVGVVSIAVGQAWMTSDIAWQLSWAGFVFWCGIAAVILTGIILVLFEKDSVSLVLDLNEVEDLANRQKAYIEYLSRREQVLLSWQSITKLLSEILDQALTDPDLNLEKKKTMLTAIVEILADYKLTLMQIADEYCNVSIYEYSKNLEPS